MELSAPKTAKESLEKFKARLTATAMATSKTLLGKAVKSIKTRAQAIYDAGGKDIAED